MINRVCFECGEYVSDVWTVQLKDDKETREYSGHYKCVTELHNRIKNVKNVDKKSVEKIIKELNL
jgi:DNA-directed RNA polymerase subunit N (RpoN/RPB10)